MWCWSFFSSRLWPNSDGKWSESTAEKGLQIVEYSTSVRSASCNGYKLIYLSHLTDIQVQKLKMGNLNMEIQKHSRWKKKGGKRVLDAKKTEFSPCLLLKTLGFPDRYLVHGQSRRSESRVQRPPVAASPHVEKMRENHRMCQKKTYPVYIQIYHLNEKIQGVTVHLNR